MGSLFVSSALLHISPSHRSVMVVGGPHLYPPCTTKLNFLLWAQRCVFCAHTLDTAARDHSTDHTQISMVMSVIWKGKLVLCFLLAPKQACLSNDCCGIGGKHMLRTFLCCERAGGSDCEGITIAHSNPAPHELAASLPPVICLDAELQPTYLQNWS